MSQTPSITFSQQRSAQKERMIRATVERVLYFSLVLHTGNLCFLCQRALRLGLHATEAVVDVCASKAELDFCLVPLIVQKGKLNIKLSFLCYHCAHLWLSLLHAYILPLSLLPSLTSILPAFPLRLNPVRTDVPTLFPRPLLLHPCLSQPSSQPSVAPTRHSASKCSKRAQ